MAVRLILAGLLGLSTLTCPAMAADKPWYYFEAPVKVIEIYRNKIAEGYIYSGVDITDKYDKYTIICTSRTEQGFKEPGSLTRWKDGYIENAPGSPKKYLSDPRPCGRI